MCVQRSMYCSKPYTEGFEYAIKMRERNIQEDIQNPYDDEALCSRAFEDGYRDGLFTSMFHGMAE